MEKMKKMKYKIVTIMLSLITLATTVLPASAVYADDTITYPNTYCVQDGNIKSSFDDESDPHILGYYSGELTLEETQKYICFYCWGKDGNYMKLQPIYNQKYINWNNDFYYTITYSDHVSTSSALCQNNYSGSLKYYIFNSEEEANAYLATGDSEGAINKDDLREEITDLNLPYYDKYDVSFDSSSNALKYQMWDFNGDVSGSLSVEMSDLQKVKLEEQNNIYYRYVDFAVYLKQFQDMNMTPDQESEDIKTDSDKRLIVGSIEATSEEAIEMAKIFSVVDGETADIKLVQSKVVDSKTYLNATESLSLTFSNKHVIDRNVLLKSRYKLIGHVIAVQCYIVDEDNNIKVGNITFGYGWRQGYGKNIGDGGYVYDPTEPNPPVPVDPVEPSDEPDDFDLITYVKNLYSQLTSYFTLTKHELSPVPAAIWGLILTALSVNLAVVIFKALRGM